MSVMDLLPRIKLERESDVRKKVAIGTGLGFAVGAVAGVLLAPKAGKETRNDLGKTYDEAHKVVSDATGLSGLNEDILKGRWHELKGGIKAKWGKLTDDEIATVDGQSEKLMGIFTKRSMDIPKKRSRKNTAISLMPIKNKK